MTMSVEKQFQDFVWPIHSGSGEPPREFVFVSCAVSEYDYFPFATGHMFSFFPGGKSN